MSQLKDHSEYLLPCSLDVEYDLICVGFGPAGLAIAAALHDSVARRPQYGFRELPKVLFVEKQASFAWHAGMLLPGTKMQISFVKDLATLRDPSSRFTFLNYLHSQGRLVDFTNLDTFLPSRVEYADYMAWCASYFENVVEYSQQVLSVTPDYSDSAIRTFTVLSQHIQTGQTTSHRGRNVVFATGGQPSIPRLTPRQHGRVIHSSRYAGTTPQVLPDSSARYRIAVLGAGQSAAEIFVDLQHKYPNAEVWLVMRQEFLRPSDDSPFINSIFNTEYTDCMFKRSAVHRNRHIADVRATNYGVVRLTLLEHMYEHMYEQKRNLGPDERTWPHRILGSSHITKAAPREDGRLSLCIQSISNDDNTSEHREETMDADLVIAATGYQRRAHVEMLRQSWNLLPVTQTTEYEMAKEGTTGWNVEARDGSTRKLAVGRDYQVQFQNGAIQDGSGIWLQGCCEGTHGLSDTLLSVLATRSSEIVQSVFGEKKAHQRPEKLFQSRL